MVKNNNCAFHEEFNKLVQELNYYKKAYEDTNGLLSKAKNELMLQAEEINELEELNIFMEGGIEMLNSLLEIIDAREGHAQRPLEEIREKLLKMVEYEEKAKNELIEMKNSKMEQVKLICITNINNECLRKEITRLRRKCSCLQGITVASVQPDVTNNELKDAITELKALQVLTHETQSIRSEFIGNPNAWIFEWCQIKYQKEDVRTWKQIF
uniref:Uncharacterized protein n=1 Tax=Ascaris lumbricoides TaxID=6252 RepID=A0A0M3IIY5_ASCLU